MPLTDQARIARERSEPRIVRLWFALQALGSTVRFMQSGAHPDDEISAMLAALRFRDGLSIAYACANRGEGGQNDIGTETTEDLGVLRTAEMERAADILDLRLYWLSVAPEDTIFDFGFSKSGRETLKNWGRDRTIHRFVEIVRTERPDILCPTFLDVPGQHGHHRAMTEMAHIVMDAAADSAFPGVELAPWAISKLYLPAWSGAGGSYDDELPPPPATLTISGADADPVTGWSHARIGEQSRAAHRTQGMGRWVPAGAENDWPLHLARSRLSGPDGSITAGLPADLGDLAGEAGPAADDLKVAARRCAEALDAFPDHAAILAAASDALRHLRTARDAAGDGFLAVEGHRLEHRDAELSRIVRLAAGVDVHGHVGADRLRPGERTTCEIEMREGIAEAVDVALALPETWTVAEAGIGPAAETRPTDPYPSVHIPSDPRLPALSVTVTAAGVASTTRVALEVTPMTLPDRSAEISPQLSVVNTATGQREIVLSISDVIPRDAEPAFWLPGGWSGEAVGAAHRITVPGDVAEGLFELPLTLDGAPASVSRLIDHPHIAPCARSVPATATVRLVSANIPDAAIGYVGGGGDRVREWLSAIGARVTPVSDAELAEPARLAAYDTLVIGVFTLKFRTGLLEAMPAIRSWVEGGGTLLTLYHRPWDNWDPDTAPPRRLEIGQPSLRWRVTDETAPVHHLVPDHRLLNTPNRITSSDWDGWHKERGLYFAKSWDEAYVPLLEMADPDEAPHRGALLSAEIGAGRHTHCALILHHQMEKLTPGAFRLMANLVAPRRP